MFMLEALRWRNSEFFASSVNSANWNSNGMVEDAAAANRAGNAGKQPATHTTGAAPRPASRSGCRRVDAERRMQSERK